MRRPLPEKARKKGRGHALPAGKYPRANSPIAGNVVQHVEISQSSEQLRFFTHFVSPAVPIFLV